MLASTRYPHRLLQTKVDGVGLVSHLKFEDPPTPGAARREVHCALLADPHISAEPDQTYGPFHVSRNLAATVAEVVSATPEIALMVGDIAWQQGLPGDYTRFHALIQPLAQTTTICLTVGNHDHRRHFLSSFEPSSVSDGVVPERSIVVVERKPIRMILLDSLFRNDLVPGFLGKAQRDWLDDFLANADPDPTLICVHHPLDDGDTSLLDGARLLCVVQQHRNVKAIFHGHDHAYRHWISGDLHIVGLPAIGMPLKGGEPLGWIDARFREADAELSFRATETGDGDVGKRYQELVWRD